MTGHAAGPMPDGFFEVNRDGVLVPLPGVFSCWSRCAIATAAAGAGDANAPALVREVMFRHIILDPDAGHAFLHQSGDEPGKVVAIPARITHAGYHEPSAQDAHRRIIAFFDAPAAAGPCPAQAGTSLALARMPRPARQRARHATAQARSSPACCPGHRKRQRHNPADRAPAALCTGAGQRPLTLNAATCHNRRTSTRFPIWKPPATRPETPGHVQITSGYLYPPSYDGRLRSVIAARSDSPLGLATPAGILR